MRLASVYTILSALASAGAVASWLAGWHYVAECCLLAWALFLPFLSGAMSWRPVRKPGLGLFLGFFALVAMGELIVVQVLRVADVLQDPSRLQVAAWPLTMLAIWIFAMIAMGLGAGGFPVLFDGLGLATAAGLAALAVAVWAGNNGLIDQLELFTGIVYALWGLALGVVTWSWKRAQRPRFATAGSGA